MRTTLNLDDDLFRAAKAAAAERGETLTRLVEEALREHLQRLGERPAFRLEWKPVHGRRLRGVDVSDRDALYERMEGRR